MTLRKRGDIYIADHRDIGGTRQSLFTTSPDLGRQLHNEVERLVLNGEKVTSQVVRALTTALTSPRATTVATTLGTVAPLAARSAGITLTKAFQLTRAQRDKWREAKAMHTIEANFAFIAAHFGAARTLDSITTSDMRAYRIQMLEEGLAPSTINARVSMISVLFAEAEQAGFLVECPKIRRVSIKRVAVPPLSEETERQVIAWFAASDTPSDAIMADLVPFLLDTGFRLSEALVLNRHTTIDFARGMVSVLDVDAKGGLARSVPMTSRVRAILQRRGDSPFGTLLIGRADKRWSLMREALGRGNDPLFKIHALRHTCCNRLVQRGMDTASIQQWMGHADIATTMLYVHGAGLNLERLRDALEPATTCATAVQPEVVTRLEGRIESQQLMHSRIGSI